MAQDQFEIVAPAKPPGHGRIVVAGVAGACALGVGLGLWARPAPPESPKVAMVKPAAAPGAKAPSLQIVIDDTPAPIGRPLEVLPADAVPAIPSHVQPEPLPPPVPAEPMAPRRAPDGLVKVGASAAAAPIAAVPLVIAARAQAEPETESAKATPARKAEKPPKAEPKSEKAEAKPKKARKAEPAPTKLAKAEPKKAEPKKKTEKASDKRKLAKAETARKARDKAERPAKLAKAEAAAKKKPDPKTEKAPRLAALVKAVKTAPKKLKARAELAEAKAAPRKSDGKPAAKKLPVEKASAKAAKPTKPAKPKRPMVSGEGPRRVAANEACALSDPGEALVCADSRLGARDRQLQRAFRDAEAAGVPASALRRQQARWLQARAAAAREAPWAVEDVYEARIAELNDLTRDARDN